MEQFKYRVIQRGKQDYIMPLVGQSFTKETRDFIITKLRNYGYFASVISQGRIAFSKITGNNCRSLINIFGS